MRGVYALLPIVLGCSDVVAARTFDVLATDGANVFYMERLSGGDGRLLRISGQSTTTVLPSGTGEPVQLVTDGASVFWTSYGSLNGLNGASSDGTNTRTFASSATLLPIAVSDTEVFWFAAGTTVTLQAILKDGNATARTIANVANPLVTAFVVTPEESIWADWNDQNMSDTPTGAIREVPIAGGSAAVVAQLNAFPDGLVSDSDSIYWVAFTSTGGTVVKTPLSGGGPTQLTSFSGALSTCDGTFSCGLHDRLRISGNDLFWSDGRTIRRIPKAGGDMVVVVDFSDSSDSISRFAVTTSSIYFTTSSGLHRESL